MLKSKVVKPLAGVVRRASVRFIETVVEGVAPRELVKHLVAGWTLRLGYELLKHWHLF